MIPFPLSAVDISCSAYAPSLARLDSNAASPGPAHPLVLRSPQLELILDRDDALPYEYRLLSNNAVIHGEAAGRGITATVFRSSPREYANVTVKPHDVKSAKTRADFQFT